MHTTPSFDQVADDYTHYQKRILPAEPLISTNGVFKWYLIFPETLPITDAQLADARMFLLGEIEAKRFQLLRDVGFVVLHRTAEYLIIYACVWRNNNELWEALYNRHLPTGEPFRQLHREDTTPTFCVWVLAAVQYEHQAWSRYLHSARDQAAKEAYLADRLTGVVE